MQSDLSQILGKAFVGLVVRVAGVQIPNVLLYGARINPIGAAPEEFLGGLKRGATFLEKEKDTVGDLGSRARSLLAPFEDSPPTFEALKPLRDSMVPIFTQAVQKFGALGTPGANSAKRGFQELIDHLEAIGKLGQDDEALFGVDREFTVHLQGPQKLVDKVASELEALAKRYEAETLEAYATREGRQVTECSAGHVVFIDGDQMLHTNVDVSPEMREVLGGKLLRNAHQIPCDDVIYEDDEQDEEDEDEETTPSESPS
jgi:hypothetical protein